MITNKIGEWKVGVKLHMEGKFRFDPRRVEVGIFDNGNELRWKFYGLRVDMGEIEEGNFAKFYFNHCLMKGFCIQSTETDDYSPHFLIKREPMILT